MTWNSSRENIYDNPKGQCGLYIDTKNHQKLNVQIFFIFPLVNDISHKDMTLLFNLIFSVRSVLES